MRKIVTETLPAQRTNESDGQWLDLETVASVEVSSEDPSYPIESALSLEGGRGWRASQGGAQQLRILFDEPVALRRIQLRFDEPTRERTQEFTIRWSAGKGKPAREIVRQQWNFSATGSTTEVENFTVELADVSVLEIAIRPDIGGRDAIASLTSLRVA